jgi:thermostable 8-oxoguanine DNA glycosylase
MRAPRAATHTFLISKKPQNFKPQKAHKAHNEIVCMCLMCLFVANVFTQQADKLSKQLKEAHRRLP